MNDLHGTDKRVPPARRMRRWTIAAVVGLVLPSVVVWLLFARFEHGVQITPQIAVTATPPSLITKWRTATTGTTWALKVSSNNIPAGQLILRGSPWEGPIMLLSGETPHELVCVYFNDTHMEVVLFDLNTPARGPPPADLGWIVVASPWRAHRLVAWSKFTTLARRLEQMDEREFKRQSLPALNLGPFYLKMSRTNVISHLEKRADPNYNLN